LGRDTGWLYNESWSALVSRAANHAVFNAQPDVLAIWAVSVSLALVSLAAALVFVRPGIAALEVRGAQFGACIAAMLLAGSVTWLPHDVHLLIPLAAASALAARGVTRRRLVTATAAVVIAFFVVAPPLLNIGVTPE